MSWQVHFHPEFEPEFDELEVVVRLELVAAAHLLEEYGPGLGRPRVDTLAGSKCSNMK